MHKVHKMLYGSVRIFFILLIFWISVLADTADEQVGRASRDPADSTAGLVEIGAGGETASTDPADSEAELVQIDAAGEISQKAGEEGKPSDETKEPSDQPKKKPAVPPPDYDPTGAGAYKVTQKVWFDVYIGNDGPQRVTIGLFGEVVPNTVKNFVALCRGGLRTSTGRDMHYKNSKFHKIIQRMGMQGGKMGADDAWGESIYGGFFPDESFEVKHTGPGLLTMANHGPNTNGAQFFITFFPLPHLDGKHVVFGKVLDGWITLKKAQAVGSPEGHVDPRRPVVIVDSGVHENTEL